MAWLANQFDVVAVVWQNKFEIPTAAKQCKNGNLFRLIYKITTKYIEHRSELATCAESKAKQNDCRQENARVQESHLKQNIVRKNRIQDVIKDNTNQSQINKNIIFS